MRIEEYEGIIPNFEDFIKKMKEEQPYWMRVNTLKIEERKLIERLESKGFKFKKYRNLNAYKIISIPVKHPGATVEHSLGYYYVQDLSSMMPVIALDPEPGDMILDMAAAPGSKTTMIAEIMKNEGTIIANDVSVERIRALAGNIERLGVTNTIITRKNATQDRWKLKFDKILLDAPCTGEGIMRKKPSYVYPTLREHIKMSEIQKKMVKNACKHLRDNGILVYSTCTFNPLENEGVVDYAIRELEMQILPANLPVPHSPGVTRWRDYEFTEDVKYAARIYPHQVDTGGMFIAVLKK